MGGGCFRVAVKLRGMRWGKMNGQGSYLNGGGRLGQLLSIGVQGEAKQIGGGHS